MNFERQRTTVDTQPFAFHLGVLCVRQTHIAQIDRGAQSKWNDARINNPRSASEKNSPRSLVPKKYPSIGQRPINAAGLRSKRWEVRPSHSFEPRWQTTAKVESQSLVHTSQSPH